MKKPYRRIDIKEWLDKLLASGSISQKDYYIILEDNEKKEDKFKTFNLPTYPTWEGDDFESIIVAVPSKEKMNGNFFIRCAAKNPLDSSIKVQRDMNLSWNQVLKFIKNLPREQKCYSYRLRNQWNGYYSGIIISNKGKFYMEMIRGNLLNIEKAQYNSTRKAAVDFDFEFHLQFTQCTVKEKMIMLEAIRFFTPNLTRESLRELKIYAEFIFTRKHGFVFIDVSQLDFWCKL